MDTDNGLIAEPASAPIESPEPEIDGWGQLGRARRLMRRLRAADAPLSDLADAQRLIDTIGCRGWDERYRDLTGYFAWRLRETRNNE